MTAEDVARDRRRGGDPRRGALRPCVSSQSRVERPPPWAGAALVAFLLSGCVGEAGDPVDASYTIVDLQGLVEHGDGLTSLDFAPSEVITAAGEDSAAVADRWEHAGGHPAECLPIFGTSYLLDGTEGGAGGDDPTMELAVYREPAAGARGLVIVNGRIFDDEAAAAGFLASVAEFAGSCASGYSLKDEAGEVVWSVDGFRLGTFEGAPDGVATLSSQELIEADASPEQRTTFIQRGNAVLAFFAETYEGGTFSVGDVDEVIGAVAERFAAVS